MSAFENLVQCPNKVQVLLQGYLDSDCPSFDVGGYVVGSEIKTARLLMKSPGVISGSYFAKQLFTMCGLKDQKWFRQDGDFVSEEEASKKLCVCVLKGPANKILLAERTALNIMSRASGVASISRKVKDKVSKHLKDWKGTVAGTRKTTPGFGLIEKYSMLVGGVATHRLDLSQMTMLKDNHVWSTGSISLAVSKAKKVVGFSSKIEVECRSFEEAEEAINCGADIVMLDNYDDAESLIKEARKLKQKHPNVLIEASGGITEDTICDYVDQAVDIISMGKLTQGYDCVDFSLKIDR